MNIVGVSGIATPRGNVRSQQSPQRSSQPIAPHVGGTNIAHTRNDGGTAPNGILQGFVRWWLLVSIIVICNGISIKGCRRFGTPDPSQGNMEDGLPNANMCMQSALRKLRKRQQNKNDDASNPLQQHSNSSRVVSVHNTDRTASAVSLKTIQPRLSIKPYGLCVAIPVYLILTLVGRTFISQLWLLPIWPLWIRSWLLQVKSVMALASATVLGQIGSLLQEGFGKLLIWSKLHRMAPQYISI